MWLLFHRSGKTRRVENGEAFMTRCPACDRDARFIEVELIKSYGLFFVDLIDDKERAYRCTSCRELFTHKDAAPEQPAAKPPRSTKSLAELQRDHEATARTRREAVEAKAAQIEDELAALKKRMGR